MRRPSALPRSARLAIGLALGLAATFPAQAKDAKPDKYVNAGKPVDCIQINRIRSSQVRDDRTIDFLVGGNKIYRNILPNSCPSLGFEKRFSYATSLSQLCSVDIVTVLIQGGGGPGLMRGASCGLGSFQPMEKTK